MANSIIYMANTNATAIANGGIVDFGRVIRRYGCGCYSNGNTPYVNQRGYYSVDANFTLVPSGGGTAKVTLYKDGVPIQGATASWSVAADTTYSFTIPAAIRQNCCCDSTITAVLTGVAGTLNNATIRVVKE